MLHKNLLLAAIVMLGMTACHDNEECGCPIDNPVEARITGELVGMQSRVTGNKWSYDQIGIRVSDAPTSNMNEIYRNMAYETESDGLVALFTPVTKADAIFFKDNTEIVTFTAYAPYSKSLPSVLPGNNGAIDINTRNSNNNETGQISINYLYAEGAKASKSNPIVAFTKVSEEQDYSFKHKMSRLILKFKSSITDGFNGNEIFTTKSGAYKLGGLSLVGNFNVTTGKAMATGPIVTDWDISNCIHNDDHAEKIRSFTLLLLPQDHGPKGRLTIAINVNNTTYTNNTIIDACLEEGKSYTYMIILKKNGLEVSGSTITDWIDVAGGEGAATTDGI